MLKSKHFKQIIDPRNMNVESLLSKRSWLIVAFSLGGLERKAKKAIKDVADTTASVVQNTINDIDFILRNVGNCISAIGNIGVRVAQRSIEYHTAGIRILIDNGIIPALLIDQAFKIIENRIRRDPKPRMFKLTNYIDNPLKVILQRLM
jgi:hypothetical protein